MIVPSEKIRVAYSKLPVAIREYLAGQELGEATEAIGTKYNLHVDTIGALNREAANMLLGITNPTQFVAELKSAGIAPESIGPIVQEMNEKVFVPLHARMMEPGAAKDGDVQEDTPRAVTSGVTVSAPAAPYDTKAALAEPMPAPAPVAHPQIPMPAAVPAYMPPPPPVAPPPAPPAYSPPPVPPPPAPAASNLAPPAPTPIYVPQPEAPEMRTMQTDMAMMKAGVHPAPVPPTMVRPPAAPPQSFNPPAHSASLPPAIPAPRPVQAVPPLSPAQAGPAPRPKPQQAPQSESRQALHDILKEYGVDPYREPVE